MLLLLHVHARVLLLKLLLLGRALVVHVPEGQDTPVTQRASERRRADRPAHQPASEARDQCRAAVQGTSLILSQLP